MPDPEYLMALRVTHDHAFECSCSDCALVRRHDQPEGCVCGHGAYNHGGGHTAIGRIMGEHSRCIRCSCMEFRRSTTEGVS